MKKTIGKALKMLLWKKYCGENYYGNCDACNRQLEIDNFEAGHVIAEKNGGKAVIDNLRVLCKPCNGSCGTKNLNDFKAAMISSINNKHANVDDIFDNLIAQDTKSVSNIIPLEVFEDNNKNTTEIIAKPKKPKKTTKQKRTNNATGPLVYKCDTCNHETNRIFNYNKHILSKKHIENVLLEAKKHSELAANIPKSQIYVCKFCNNSFTRASSCTRHMKLCYASIADNKEKDIEIKILKAKLDELSNNRN